MLSAGLVPYIPFDPLLSTPFYTQVYQGLRTAIIAGRLGPGERLPSTRALAVELKISRLPVLIAFEQLLHEGYLVARVGSGTYITDRIPDEVARPSPWRRRVLQEVQAPRVVPAVSVESSIADGQGLFRVGQPALDHFPQQRYARLLRRHASNPSIDLLGHHDPRGYLPLRAAIVEYLRSTRAVDCTLEQVLIVSGAHMALRIAASALTNPGSAICVEDPGYRVARSVLAAAGAPIVQVPVDDEGIDVCALRELGERATLVYVTPSHQFPTGVALAISRRRELLEWAESTGGWIVEDDYDSEFHFDARPLGSLQGMDTGGHVIYVGTFSKVMFPAIRLGYLVVPPALVPDFVRVRASYDLFAPLLHQMALTDFLVSGEFGRHLRRMRAVYFTRRDALVEAIRDSASDVLTIANADAGMHIVTHLPDYVDDREVARLAKSGGMLPSPLSPCYAGSPGRNGLLLGLGAPDEAGMGSAIQQLSRLIRNLR